MGEMSSWMREKLREESEKESEHERKKKPQQQQQQLLRTNTQNHVVVTKIDDLNIWHAILVQFMIELLKYYCLFTNI